MVTTQAVDCELLAWDTAFWGFPIARVLGESLDLQRAERVDAWCDQSGIRCAYFMAQPEDYASLGVARRHDFRVVDVRVTFARPPKPLTTIPGGREAPFVRHSQPTDVPILESIARVSYHGTRFYQDGGFPRDRCDELYATWIRQSCKDYADAVLVAVDEDQPLGYVSCHLEKGGSTGRIGLLGTSPSARGRGIGSTLVAAALEWFAAHQVGEVRVATQGCNSPAQRLYQRCGFTTSNFRIWLHKWYGGSADE